MEPVAALGGGLFALASLIVGGRLMWLARTTRGFPEAVLGIGLFLMGGVGYPLMMVAIQATGLPSGLRIVMLAVQMLLMGGGMTSIAWFTRRVFRPNESWSASLLAGIGAAYAAVAGAQIVGPGLQAYLDTQTGPWRATLYLGIVVMTWAGAESFHYWTLLRKRLRLGLADPVAADRLRLWAIAILTADSISVTSLAFELAGVRMVGTAAGSLLVGTLGLVTASCLWLAFVPPRAYVERIRRRSTPRVPSG